VLGKSTQNAKELARQLAFAQENAAALGGSRVFVGLGQKQMV
jgi:hypothetical protein